MSPATVNDMHVIEDLFHAIIADFSNILVTEFAIIVPDWMFRRDLRIMKVETRVQANLRNL